MHKYVRYVRTVEGHIERISYAVYNSPHDFFAPYLHQQQLRGWPESHVFWAKETGPSVGIAPLMNREPNKTVLALGNMTVITRWPHEFSPV
jgi:hypothetical protein